MDKLNVITGGTGLLGSHIAEQLVAQGERVRVLVRPTSDRTFLDELGVEYAVGDLSDPESLRRAVEGADVVYHCAARVGDWGPWMAFQREVIDATVNLLGACRAVGVGRVLHVSSITVYGHPHKKQEGLYTEEYPLGQNLWFWGDYYCRAKIQAETLCREYPGPLTIVRPSWIYGPRDRNSFPRLVKAMRVGRVGLIGRGDNLLNIIYAGDVASGAIRAANHPDAIGQVYNLASEGEVTQRQLLDTLTEALGTSRVRWRYPYGVAFYLGFLSEIVGRAIFLRRPPYITRYVVSLVGRPTQFSTAKAREQLGWQPQVPVAEGIRRTLQWYNNRTESKTAQVVESEQKELCP